MPQTAGIKIENEVTECETVAEEKQVGFLKTRKGMSFNQEVADEILRRVIEGATIQAISREPGSPPAWQIYVWGMENPTFGEHLKRARQLRAEFFHDKAIDVAIEAKRKSDVSVAKLKSDTYKWAAEAGSPAQYGRKYLSEEHGKPAPTVIVIDTGIRRERSEPTIVIESTEIKEPE